MANRLANIPTRHAVQTNTPADKRSSGHEIVDRDPTVAVARGRLEVDGYREGGRRPVAHLGAVVPPLVLGREQAPGEPVFRRVCHDAGDAPPRLVTHPHGDRRPRLQVANPVGSLSSTRKQIQRAVADAEPDLDGVRPARAAADRGDVAEALGGPALGGLRQPSRCPPRAPREVCSSRAART